MWPSRGAVHFAPRGDLTISWNAGDVVTDSWQVVRSNGPLDVNGGCADAAYQTEAPVTTPDAGTSLLEPAEQADRCYLYAVWPQAADPSTDAATYVSGPVRILTTWDGTYNLYRKGVFSTQTTLTWCVAASIQMMLNIVNGQQDHSKASQQRYIDYARLNDLYRTPAAKGTDARGWAASLNFFGGSSGYHDASNPRYKRSIRMAVRRLRQTGKPVGLVVAHSNHAWVLAGFEATSDPGLDPLAQITALYVTGTLWPRTTHNGYDLPPDTRFTFLQLKQFHTRYYDSSGPNNPWEGTFVTVLP